MLYVALFLHDIAKGRPEDHSIAGARIARKLCPRFGLTAAQTETVAWLVEHHLLMSDDRAVARPQRPQDDPRLRRRRAEPRAAEDAADPHRRRHQGGRPRRLERLEGPAPAHALLRDRAGADRRPQPGEPRPARRRRAGANSPRALADWPEKEREAYLERHYPAYWLRVDLPRKVAHAEFIREADREQAAARHRDPHPRLRGGDRDHRASRPTTRGCCRSSPAPAPSPAPTSSTRRSSPPPTARRSTSISISREFDDERRRGAPRAEASAT